MSQCNQPLILNYNDVISRLHDYMLSGQRLSQHTRKLGYFKSSENNPTPYKSNTNTNTNTNTNISTLVSDNKDRFFSPKENDSLFWCFFILRKGFGSYEYPGTTSYVNEKSLKFKYIDFLRENKQILKIHKIRNLSDHVEDELANKERIGMKTFVALCATANINVLFIHKRKCFEMIVNESDKINIVHQRDGPKKHFVIENDCSSEQLTKYRTDYFTWESVDKPIKAISSYKVSELLELCKQMELDKTNDLTRQNKKDLYEMLLLSLS